MKKLIFILTFLVAGIAAFGQSERVMESDLKIKTTTPRLYLQGLGGTILIQGTASGTLTLRPYAATSGTIVLPSSASTDTLATQTYSRAHGGGSMVYPGAGIPLSTGAAWGASIVNNSADWNSAAANQLMWSGGATGLNALVGRMSLGGTTVGMSFFTLANPTAIRFPRIKADNSVEALSAADFRTAITAPAYYETTSNLAAGDETDVTLVGVTTAPYSVTIFDADDWDMTHAVKDSIGISGGVYHVYIYSTDAKTNAKIKVLW